MFNEHVTLLNDIMVAYPHRNPNCNTLDEFIGKMEGFRTRYQQLLVYLPHEKMAELVAKQKAALQALSDEEGPEAPVVFEEGEQPNE